MMNKRQQILQDLDEELITSDIEEVFDQLDRYQMKPPSIEATNQLIQSLKPIFSQELLKMKRKQRFREMAAAARKENTFSAALSLVVSQAALISKEFAALTIAFFMVGLLVSYVFSSGSSKF